MSDKGFSGFQVSNKHGRKFCVLMLAEQDKGLESSALPTVCTLIALDLEKLIETHEFEVHSRRTGPSNSAWLQVFSDIDLIDC